MGRASVNGRQDRGRHVEVAVLHAFADDEFAGERLEPDARPLHEQHFEAVMVFKMNVLRGDDLLEILVLNLHQPRLQSRLRVVVH